MGINQKHGLSREQTLFIKQETTFGTIVHPAGTDAFKARSFTPGTGTIERLKRDDNRLTRSTEEHITGKQAPAEWSLEAYVLPSGTAGTPPDIHELLLAAFGAYTNVPATSDTYTLTDTQGDQKSLSISQNASETMMNQLVGCVVQTMNLKGAGGEPPVFTISGVARDRLTTGRSAIDNTVTGANVPVDDPNNFVVGSRVQILQSDGETVRDDDSGDGFIVLSKDATSITLDTSPTGSPVVTDIVAPFQPTETTAGSPVPGIIATLQIDHGAGDVTLPVLSYEFNLANNHVPFLDEVGQQLMTDWVEDFREVTGQFVVRARADQVHLLNRAKDFGSHAITLTLGNTAGNICTLTMPTAELGFNDDDYAPGDSVKLTLPLMGLGTQNEIQLQFT